MDDHRIFGVIVGDAHGRTLHFADGVGVIPCRREGQFGEGYVAVGIVGGSLLHLAVGIFELEGELPGFQIPAIQLLGGIDLCRHSAGGLVGIGKLNGDYIHAAGRAGDRLRLGGKLLDGLACGKRTVSLAGHVEGNQVHMGVIGNTALVVVHFLHEEAGGGAVLRRQRQAVKIKGCLLAVLHGGGFAMGHGAHFRPGGGPVLARGFPLEHKLEFARLQVTSGEELGALDVAGNRACRVGEGRLRGVACVRIAHRVGVGIADRLHFQLAVVVGPHRHGNRGRMGILHQVRCGGSRLGDGVGISTRLGIADGSEGGGVGRGPGIIGDGNLVGIGALRHGGAVLGRQGEGEAVTRLPFAARNGLGHGELLVRGQRDRDRFVLHPHDGAAGEQPGQIFILQFFLVALIAGIIVLGDLDAGPALGHLEEPLPVHAVGGAVLDDGAVGVVGQIQRLSGIRPGGPVDGTAVGDRVGRVVVAGVQRRRHVGEVGVDFVGHRKLQHAAHHATHAVQHADVVVRIAGIGVDAGFIHADLHQRGVDGIAVRRVGFLQVVGLPHIQGVALGGEHGGGIQRDAVILRGQVAGGHGVVGLGIRVQGRHFAGGIHLVGFVQLEGDTFVHGVAVFVHLLDHQIILDVGHIQPHREFTLKIARVAIAQDVGIQPMGVVHRGTAEVGCLGIIVGDGKFRSSGSIRPLAGQQHMVVGLDVAGQVFDGDFIGTAAVQLEDILVRPGSLQHILHRGVGAVVLAVDGPAAEGIARYRVPVTVCILGQDHGKVGAVVLVGIIYRVPVSRLGRVGQGGCDDGAGIGAGIPGVAAQKHGLGEALLRGEVQVHIPGGTVARGGGNFFQDKFTGLAGAAVLFFQVIQAEQHALVILEDEGAVAIGGAGGNFADCLVVVVGGVQFKLCALDRVALLVHLAQVALGNRDQVEFQGHVGVHVAPLQVVEPQGMVGAVGKGIAFPAGSISPPGILVFAPQRTVTLAVDRDYTGGEVDLQAGGVMDTAQIAHQHIVDEDPDVIVAAEFIGDDFSVFGQAVLLLHKAGGHGQTEVMVDRTVGRLDALRIGQCGQRVEGEELSVGR